MMMEILHLHSTMMVLIVTMLSPAKVQLFAMMHQVVDEMKPQDQLISTKAVLAILMICSPSSPIGGLVNSTDNTERLLIPGGNHALSSNANSCCL